MANAKVTVDAEERPLLRAIGGRFRDNFATGYLTLVSIVLGVALAALGEELFRFKGEISWQSVEWWVFLGRCVLTFALICGTFHYYYFFVSLVRILPFFVAIFNPFALGGGLVVLAHLVGNADAFWLAAGVNFLIAAAAFGNSVYVNDKALLGEQLSTSFGRESWKNIIFFLGMAVFTFALLLYRVPYSELYLLGGNFIALTISTTMTLGFLKRAYRLIRVADALGGPPTVSEPTAAAANP